MIYISNDKKTNTLNRREFEKNYNTIKLYNYFIAYTSDYNLKNFRDLFVIYKGDSYINNTSISLSNFINNLNHIKEIEENISRLVGSYQIFIIDKNIFTVYQSLYKESDLYFYNKNDLFKLSSDIRELENKLTINKKFISKFIDETDDFGLDSPFTNIYNLPVGHQLQFYENNLSIKYIEFDKDENSIIDSIINNLNYFTKPNDKVYINFSGGLDSSILLYAATKIKNKINLTALHWYSKNELSDEIEIAKNTASQMKIKLVKKEQFDQSLPRDTFQPKIFISSPYQIHPLISGLIKETGFYDYKMKTSNLPKSKSFTGQGGDLIFLQNPSYNIFYDAVKEKGILEGIRALKNYSILKGKRFIPTIIKAASCSRKTLLNNESLEKNNISNRLLKKYNPNSAKYHHIRGIFYGLNNIKTYESMNYSLMHPLYLQNTISKVINLPTYKMINKDYDRYLIRQEFYDKSSLNIAWRQSKKSSSGLVFNFFLNNKKLILDYILNGIIIKYLKLNKNWIEEEIIQNSSIATTVNAGLILNILQLEIYYKQFSGVNHEK